MPREREAVYQPGRIRAQGQKQGYLPKKKQEISPPADPAGSQPLTAGDSEDAETRCRQRPEPYAGSHAQRWPPRQRGRPYLPKTHQPTRVTARPQLCGGLIGMPGDAETASFQSREGNSREYTSACDLGDTSLQAQITYFTSDICCHGGRFERGCLKFN